MPHQVAALPDGSARFVTLVGNGWVVQFDRANRPVAREGFETPGMLVLDPATGRVRSVTGVGPCAAAPGLAAGPGTGPVGALGCAVDSAGAVIGEIDLGIAGTPGRNAPPLVDVVEIDGRSVPRSEATS